MKSLILVVILFPQLLWTPEAKMNLSRAHITRYDLPCPGRGWYSGTKEIGVCVTATAEALPMVMLHESQHRLVGQYRISDSLDNRFVKVALECSKTGNQKARTEAMKFAGLGPWELHAQLPFLLHGKLCPKLQSWYPWFELSETHTSLPLKKKPLGRYSTAMVDASVICTESPTARMK